MMKKNIQNTKNKKRRNPLVVLLSLICIGVAVFLCFQLIMLNMLPLILEVAAIVIIIVLSLILCLFYNFIAKRPISRFLSAFLILALTVVYGAGNYYIFKTNEMFASVTNLTDQMTNTISVVTLNGSGYDSLESLNNMTLGTITSQDSEGTQKALDDISSKITVETVDYTTFNDLYYALYTDQVQGIILNETFRGIVFEMDPDANNMTSVVNQTVYYTKRETKTDTVKDSVNVATEPFTILISGNDSYGGLTSNSRSDSNMLVTVNPSTHTVLMTSIPRDYYETIQCGDTDTGLACPQDERDKLTHSGLYGIDTTEKTIEEFLDITINYHVRVNFSSLTNLVDALGGIDVFVEEGLAVEQFNADWSLQGVTEGWNHLDGKRALAYARERHAYVDGDIQRAKNQQQVLEAIITKAASSTILTNYTQLLQSFSGAFDTNMSTDEITTLIRYELQALPEWKFENYVLRGYGDMAVCASSNMELSVVVPEDYSVQIASQKIQAVLDGGSADEVVDEYQTESGGVAEGYIEQENAEAYGQYYYDPNQYYDSSQTYDQSQTYDPSQVYDDSGVYDDSQYYDQSQGYTEGTDTTYGQ